MPESKHTTIAIVGLGAILPDAPDVPAFWENLRRGRYSISETPAERWEAAAYFDPDPKAPDKTYSKIGGWVRDWTWDPIAWKLPIPPRVADQMDRTQKWSVAAARQALADYDYPNRPLDPERTAVVLGNAMGGDRHYITACRLLFPEYARELAGSPSLRSLPAEVREAIEREFRAGVADRFPDITEDSMPGELANIIAGRIANLFNFKGPNYVCDAACASAMAAIGAAIEGLEQGDYDAVLTGGIDANMSPSTFIKFCKIGALSATGTRPYADGADGFVMGEGAAIFLLKRLADAERDGDRVYAVLRGVGGSSDGRGKGITAPNPVGQRLAIERAWSSAGLSPASVSLLEGHGTSTKVGDLAEVESLEAVFGRLGLAVHSVPLGSVKSNIGHLKGAAGAAGILKATLALHHREIPPSLNAERPNPSIDFTRSAFYVHRELAPFERRGSEPRRVGVSAFGFGGTNFHVVLEEWEAGRLTTRRPQVAVAEPFVRQPETPKDPLRGALLLGARDERELVEQLRHLATEAAAGRSPAPQPPSADALIAPLRLAIDYGSSAELATRAGKALHAFEKGRPGAWRVLQAQGIFRGAGAPAKVAFLYTGQGSQYVNMLAELRRREPIVAETFAEADAVMTPILGRPLSEIVFAPEEDAEAFARAEEQLKQTAITQPAVLTVDTALTRLLAAYGVTPDFVMGHSLGEYGALVAAGSLSFAEALEAVSARGQEMTKLSVADPGKMVAVFGPLEEIEAVLATVEGYAVVANLNSRSQAVVGGESQAVDRAVARFAEHGFDCRYLPVSHAFHTRIVAPASEPLKQLLRRLHLAPPRIPIVSNATGELYPREGDVHAAMIDLLARQIAEPVQFVGGLERLHACGARVFVEIGPKRALQGFVEDVLGGRDGVLSLSTNQPKAGDFASLNLALCGLYAAGRGAACAAAPAPVASPPSSPALAAASPAPAVAASASVTSPLAAPRPATPVGADTLQELGRLFADFLEKGFDVYRRGGAPGGAPRPAEPVVVVTGAALGLPGTERVFDDANLGRLLAGDQLITPIPPDIRRQMADKRVTRLVKSELGGPRFEVIESTDEVIKLAARAGSFDPAREFGWSEDRIAACDRTTLLAMAAGIDALRDAGIPLVRRYKTTTTGGRLPERWALPEEMADSTGVIFASAFPGYDQIVGQIERFERDRARRDQIELLHRLRQGASGALAEELDHELAGLEAARAREPFAFDRRFLFQVLAMGHAQFAEAIGARGPNTQINSACATTTQAFALASDWIRAGRCRRVVIVAADDITSDRLLGWFASGFLASGAAATDALVEQAALPFDRRRHGLLIGMGAAAAVLESAEAARERGLAPICQVLGTVTANSAFHGTRLDVGHIGQVMERLVAEVEQRWGIDRHAMAREMMFVSHETYTPARGGSAQAEVDALRRVFGSSADRIVIANTKGSTGHPMAVGIEDVLAVKALETGLVPPVPNIREIDPDLGELHLSRGGPHAVRFALRLGAGFGSQISMTLLGWTPPPDGARRSPADLGFAHRVQEPATWRAWLARASGDPSPELETVQRTLRVVDRMDNRSQQAGHDVAAAKPAAAVPGPTPAAAAPPAAAPRDEVRDRVLALVAEKTGYPREMLAMDLDLEADLGIDTVKQAELFAAVRAAYGIERDPNLKLKDFPTLAKTVQFVYDHRPDLRRVVPAEEPPRADGLDPRETPPTPAPPPAEDPVVATVLELVAEKTGYPRDLLALDLDLEADLGVDTVKQAELFAAVRARYGIERDPDLKLKDFPTLAKTIEFVYSRRPDLRPQPPTLASPAAGAPARDAAPPAPSAPLPSPPSGEDEVLAALLALVAEKTGYPREMLDLDLDLESDLGIDTVKQAEIFAAVRERYAIERDPNLRLKEFNTLAKTLAWVRARRPDLAAGAGTTASTEPAAGPAAEPAIAEPAPRRVPVAVLRPPLELTLPTGVGLAAGDRVAIATDGGGAAEALAGRLRARGVQALLLHGAPTAQEVEQRIAAWLGEGPIQGLYWLPALDPVGDLERLDLAGWREALRRRAKLLATALRALDAQFEQGTCFALGATRLGGVFGFDEAGASEPLGGAVVGLLKAFAREHPAALVKCIDFAEPTAAGEVAEALVDETLFDRGAVEIGRRGALRTTLALAEQPAGERLAALSLGPASVVVVTGAAGSIVSAVVRDLARSGGRFHLLDLAPAPDPADPDLGRFTSDREGLKRDLAGRLQARGERVTPVLVERELAAIERRAEALAAMAAISANGGTALYHQVDLRDAAAVHAALAELRRSGERVDVLLHAAGLEVSHRLVAKSAEEFDRVFDVKADGWFNLLRALQGVPLGAAVVFSSIAGRFGNAGQTDYAAANELLAKAMLHLPRLRPAARGITLDWTGWAAIGMASRGSIPQLLTAAGIDLLPAAEGVPVVRREIESAAGSVEVVVAKRLGAMLSERTPASGLDLDALADRLASAGPMIGRAVAWDPHLGLLIEATLDPTRQPFLNDHRIDGVAVLPGVMGIEAFVAAAILPFPERPLLAVENIEFLAPFKFFRDQPRTLEVRCQFRPEGDAVVAHCALLGARRLAGSPEVQRTLHFTAEIRLGAPGLDRPALALPLAARAALGAAADEGSRIDASSIYRILFHGPAYRVLRRVERRGDWLVGEMPGELPVESDPPTQGAPRAIEAAFQTIGVGDIAQRGALALPWRVSRLRILPAEAPPSAGLRVVARADATSGGAAADAFVVDSLGRPVVVVQGYRTTDLATGLDATALAGWRQLATVGS